MFADTSGWASAADRRQSFHNLSGTLIRQAHRTGRTIVTTNYVLAELASLLTSPLRIPRPLQIQYLTDLRVASWIEIVHFVISLDAVAWQLWQSRPDKEWSFPTHSSGRDGKTSRTALPRSDKLAGSSCCGYRR